ncbi:MAG TPA: hypothetical protein VFI25_07575 [Planctomycetota bacterium]|jgi:hypothetical protein|nr:hypothetical protein [Planctomycetota bacterium]
MDGPRRSPLGRTSALSLLPALLGGACATTPQVEVQVEPLQILEPVAEAERVPAEGLLIYPAGGIDPPSDLVRIARLRVEWNGCLERSEARYQFFRKASLLGADSLLDYREVTPLRGGNVGSWGGTSTGSSRTDTLAATLLLLNASLAFESGAITGFAARRIRPETRP